MDPTNTDSSKDKSQDPAFTDIGEDEADLEDEGKQRGASQQSRAPQGRAPQDRASQGRASQPKAVQPLNVDGFWSTNRLKRVMKRECNLRIRVEFSPSQ